MKPTLFVLSQPHTQVTSDYITCAYTSKIRHFCEMMHKEGFKIILLASEDNETPAELITCITKREQSLLGFSGPDDYLKNDFDNKKPLWQLFHQRAIYELRKRVKKGDFILSASGRCDKPIADAFPECCFIEGFIGYSGVFSPYRVYESYAWMHLIYGAGTNGDASTADGRFYDTVIPNYFDPKDFPFQEKKKDYVLYVGRLIHRKGLKIIEEVAHRMPETEFILAGHGGIQEGNKITGQDVTIEGKNLKYIGTVNIEERGELMSEAKALIVPTLYCGPFEGVSIESLFCGTPVITTNFGSFTENNVHGITGYRCSTIGEFVWAIKNRDKLDPKKIRDFARANFSMDRVAKMYTAYFDQLQTLNEKGFYSDWEGLSQERFTKYYPN